MLILRPGMVAQAVRHLACPVPLALFGSIRGDDFSPVSAPETTEILSALIGTIRGRHWSTSRSRGPTVVRRQRGRDVPTGFPRGDFPIRVCRFAEGPS